MAGRTRAVRMQHSRHNYSAKGCMKKTKPQPPAKANLSASVLAAIKDDLFSFRLMPGQRFSENEIASRLGVSLRTTAHEGD